MRGSIPREVTQKNSGHVTVGRYRLGVREPNSAEIGLGTAKIRACTHTDRQLSVRSRDTARGTCTHDR